MSGARTQRIRRLVVCALYGLGFLGAGLASPVRAATLHVNSVDATCGGLVPCYATIQEAVDAAGPADLVRVQAGTYVEQVLVNAKNEQAGAGESDRIRIEADPAAAAGSVVIDGAKDACSAGYAVRFKDSHFVTLRGFTITGAGGQAVELQGSGNKNSAIRIEANRIYGNGSDSCNGGVTVAAQNVDTLVANNLIYANGRNGIHFVDGSGGPHVIVGNTLHANGRNGLESANNHVLVIANNVITDNGTQSGATGGRYGVKRRGSDGADEIQLLHNLVCGNTGGELDGPSLDAADAGNLTPTGGEGSGVSASAGCDELTNVYASLPTSDGSSDFGLAEGAPALDLGVDPRTLGFDPTLDAIFESDFSGPAVRPQDDDADGSAAFDAGALEGAVASEPPDVPDVLYVSASDLTCAGETPCFATIQAAVDGAGKGDVVRIQAGSYVEQVSIADKNDEPGATEGDRIVIEADLGAAPGSVVLDGAQDICSGGHAIEIKKSRYVTLRGLTITGAGHQAIELRGGSADNQGIHIEGNRIFGNAPNGNCNGGITVSDGNPDTVIANNLIYANGQNGIHFVSGSGGPHTVVGNTLHANGRNGIEAANNHLLVIANNVITENGKQSTNTGGRFGVKRNGSDGADEIQLLHNLLCANTGGEIDGPALDATDAGNLTPTGTEGEGAASSPGCEELTSVFANLPHSGASSDFGLLDGSPALDLGVDPRTLGLSATLDPIFEADFTGPAARPQDDDGDGAAQFEAGAVEGAVVPGLPPTPVVLYVNGVDATCGGEAPCFATIQAAVDAVLPRQVVRIQAGNYVEQVSIADKNEVPGGVEGDRIVIEADPAAVSGSVVLDGAVDGCSAGHAIEIKKSRYVTLRGLTITGAGHQGIELRGGSADNQGIHIEGNRIFGNAPNGNCNGGITVSDGNPDTVIANNLIYANGQNGIHFISGSGGPHTVVGNTLHANGRNGIEAANNHLLVIANNVITENGTQDGSTGGRFGVKRRGSDGADEIQLLHNLICANSGGELDGPALDAEDAGNLTPTGTEGPGVAASPGCDDLTNVYAGLPTSEVTSDFGLMFGTAAIDMGIDPRGLGRSPTLDPIFESDFSGAATRPQDGDGDGDAGFDAGALEGLGMPAPPPPAVVLVNGADPTCGGASPCFATIQAGVDAVAPGDIVRIQAGTYVEQITVERKNDGPGFTEGDRIVIEADPLAAPGSVVLDGARDSCSNGQAIQFKKSNYVTLRGLTITGAGGQAIRLRGGSNDNRGIHLEGNRIFGNAPNGNCDGGISVAAGNPDTVIANNLIYSNGHNGIAFRDARGGPHLVVGNTIHANGRNGIRVPRRHVVLLANNAITENGTQSGSTGGRFGVKRLGTTGTQPVDDIDLLHNLICRNRGGEIDGPVLDVTDAGNLTPTGTEGPGVAASPGCDDLTQVYANLPNSSADSAFGLRAGSPALDLGVDPRTLGLLATLDPIFEADFTGPGVRPQDDDADGTPAFDAGALEGIAESSEPPLSLLYVNASDPICGGNTPCFATIQEAVDVAAAGEVVRIQAGTYVEQVSVADRNDGPGVTEGDRIVIEADPEAEAGSVLLDGAIDGCSGGHAIEFKRSRFVTLRGLTITGAGGQAVELRGDGADNQGIHIEANRIFGNAPNGNCDGGITVANGNPDTVIANNLIYANGKNGIHFKDANGGPHLVVGNTVHANGRNGIDVGRRQVILVANNVVTYNGTEAGTAGGRFGLKRDDASGTPPSEEIQLSNNLLCGNAGGELDGPALDATDAGNLTPTGAEGPGVAASPSCDDLVLLFESLGTLDASADFGLADGSPAVDHGVDLRTLGLAATLDRVFEADFVARSVRPQDGDGDGQAEFDAGAVERLGSTTLDPFLLEQIDGSVPTADPAVFELVRPLEESFSITGSYTGAVSDVQVSAVWGPQEVQATASEGRFALILENDPAVVDDLAILLTELALPQRSVQATLRFVPDTTPPVITIDGPTVFASTADVAIVTGTVIDAGSGVASITLVSDRFTGLDFGVTLGADGAFRAEVPLSPGENRITVGAADLAGNASEVELVVDRAIDNTPTLEITSPANGSVLVASPISVGGVVRSQLDPEDLRLTFGAQVDFPAATAVPGEYSFQFDGVHLAEGLNALQVQVASVAGDAFDEVRVTYAPPGVEPPEEPIEPDLEITSPRFDSTINGDSVVITGVASSELGVAGVTVNGTDVPFTCDESGDCYFEFTLDLLTMAGPVTIVVTDAAGGTTEQILNLLRDVAPPVLALTSPTLDPAPAVNTLSQQVVTLQGTVSDEHLSALRLNGLPVLVTPAALPDTFDFEVTVQLPLEENQDVVLRAEDLAGNIAQLDFVLFTELTVMVEIVSPLDGDAFGVLPGGALDLEVLARLDAADGTESVEVAFDGGAATAIGQAGGAVSTTVAAPAEVGNHTLTLTVRDTGGNVVGEAAVGYSVFDPSNVALEVVRTSPANGQGGIEPNAFTAIFFNKAIDPALLQIDVKETSSGLTYQAPQDAGTPFFNESGAGLVEVSRAGAPVAGAVAVLPGETTVTWEPTGDYAYNGTVFVEVVYDGVSLQRFTFTVRDLPTLFWGKVVDSFHVDVEGVTVSLPELSLSTKTDENGTYAFGFGLPESQDIPGGSYELVINPDFGISRFGGERLAANVQQGRVTQIQTAILPVLNVQIGFQHLVSGQNPAELAMGELVLDLSQASLLFPNGRTEGDVHVQFTRIEQLGVRTLEGAVPGWVFAIQPRGVEVEGGVGVSLQLPQIFGTHDYVANYLANIGQYVLIVGFEPSAETLLPVGVGEVQGTTVVALDPVPLRRLDYIGVVYVSEAIQERLVDYANTPSEERSLAPLISDLARGVR